MDVADNLTVHSRVEHVLARICWNTRPENYDGGVRSIMPHRRFGPADYTRLRSALKRAVGTEEGSRSFDARWGTRPVSAVALSDSSHGTDPTERLRCIAEGDPRKSSPVLVDSLEAFRARLAALGGDFARRFESGFPSGVVLAGGAVVACMQEPAFAGSLPFTDLDLWVHGGTRRGRLDSMAEALRRLLSVEPDSRVLVRGPVVTVIPPPRSRSPAVDVVYTDRRTPEEVVLDMDMTYVGAFYDGRRVSATWGCLWSMATRTTFVCGNQSFVPHRRFVKALRKGFRVVSRRSTLLADPGNASSSCGPSREPSRLPTPDAP